MPIENEVDVAANDVAKRLDKLRRECEVRFELKTELEEASAGMDHLIQTMQARRKELRDEVRHHISLLDGEVCAGFSDLKGVSPHERSFCQHFLDFVEDVLQKAQSAMTASSLRNCEPINIASGSGCVEGTAESADKA
eukprot:CAMPEP_0171104282 /NCGR_PEP_ID=MMETSP0766_2-20121228/60346_1 /TAXON_ID=439317 /ORGANISM="Gambierdiscus australes, Strain CAWD 149" /LENGTH=137 /DNA_ID=CAMNT_0011564885 /DNA_START=53 /DNA_END=466 /DNA_ORIENTATION=-